MTTFGEKLAAAREARPTKDVTVILDGALATRKAELIDQLANASSEARLGAKSDAEVIQAEIDDIDESSDSSVTLRFTRMPGREWATITSKNPARVDAPVDRHYGYNIDAVTETAARFKDKAGRAYGVRVEGEELVEMTDSEWDELYDVLSGNEISLIRDAIWELSEWAPAQRLNELVKASGAATRSVSK